MQLLQTLREVRHPKPITILVESRPIKEGRKLSETTITEDSYSWKDLQGLSWIFLTGKDD